MQQLVDWDDMMSAIPRYLGKYKYGEADTLMTNIDIFFGFISLSR